MNNTVIELNDENFAQEVLSAQEKVLVQFWAGWSEPCKAMTPVLQSVAEDHAPAVKVGRVNVEDHEDLAHEYGVRAVPTLLIFNQGGLQGQIVGRTTEQEVRAKLESIKCCQVSIAHGSARNSTCRTRKSCAGTTLAAKCGWSSTTTASSASSKAMPA